MKYCSHCGHQVALRWMEIDRRKRHVCLGCGKVHYENPKVLVLCLAHWGSHLLMCKRALRPQLGMWSVPGGFVETGETLEEAASRETLEETGVELDPRQLEPCFLASLPHINEVYVGFRAELAHRPHLRRGPESLEVAMYQESDLPDKQLAFGSVLTDYYRRFFGQLRSAQFSVLSMQLTPIEISLDGATPAITRAAVNGVLEWLETAG
jgi:ADP-ribose pyrophosphatase YjhB (NUDIX family)